MVIDRARRDRDRICDTGVVTKQKEFTDIRGGSGAHEPRAGLPIHI